MSVLIYRDGARTDLPSHVALSLRLLIEEGITPFITEILMVNDLFGTSYKEKTILYKRLIELPVDLILGLIRTVDEHVPAYYKMETALIRVFQA